MKNNDKWEIIHDRDDDNGNPTCWRLEINHDFYGQFAFIHINACEKYVLSSDNQESILILNTLSSAKKQANIFFSFK